MARRITTESVVYWTVQTTVIICVILTVCFSLKSSLESDKTHQRLSILRENHISRGSKASAENDSCRHPLVLFKNGSCQPPCDWSFMSSSEMKIYDYLMSNCLRIAMISTVITFLTWLACKPLRKFPHIVRFYILLSSASFTFAGILPSTLSPINPHCAADEYWTTSGIRSNTLTLQGAACHYLLLMLCFWLLGYVINTYLLLVLDKDYIFTSPAKLHATQLILCSVTPLFFVALCLLVQQPGYHMLFKDRMAILPSSYVLIFGTVTLPVLLSAGASLAMLIAVVRHVRKVSRNPRTTGHVIRSDEEMTSLKNVERHFIAIICLYALALVVIFIAESFLQDQEITYLENALEYFDCLQTGEMCSEPNRPKFFLSNLKILTPGFFCMVTFFLLFFTNKTRAVWRKWLNWITTKTRNIGRCILHWLGQCKTSFRRRERSLRMTDRVAPTKVSTLTLGSAISVNGAQDLSSYDTKATTLDEYKHQHDRNNDLVITHL